MKAVTLKFWFGILMVSMGFINFCAGGLIEYSSCTDDDIMIEMQLFNEVDDFFNECISMARQRNEYDYYLRIIEGTVFGKKSMYRYLKKEFVCYAFESTRRDNNETKYNIEYLVPYFGFWSLQVLAAEYSLIFVKGYVVNQQSDPVLAEHCLSLGVYLGTFAGHVRYRNIFLKRVVQIILNVLMDQNHPAYLTSQFVWEIFNYQISRHIDHKVVDMYNAETKSLLPDAFLKGPHLNEIELPFVKLYLTYIMFGRNITKKNPPQFPNDHKMWENVKHLLVDRDRLYDKKAGNEGANEYDQTLITILKNAENFKEPEGIMEDYKLWKSAEIIMNEVTSAASGSANDGRFTSKLVYIIRELEKVNAWIKYARGKDEASFEKSVSGINKDESKLELEWDNDTNRNSIPFHFVKKSIQNVNKKPRTEYVFI